MYINVSMWKFMHFWNFLDWFYHFISWKNSFSTREISFFSFFLSKIHFFITADYAKFMLSGIIFIAGARPAFGELLLAEFSSKVVEALIFPGGKKRRLIPFVPCLFGEDIWKMLLPFDREFCVLFQNSMFHIPTLKKFKFVKISCKFMNRIIFLAIPNLWGSVRFLKIKLSNIRKYQFKTKNGTVYTY